MRLSKLVSSLALALAACHAQQPEPVLAGDSRPAAADRRRGDSEPGFAVSGLLGALSQQEIQGALTPRLPKFARCASDRRDFVDTLSGTVALAFHLAVDGTVAAVQPSASDLGDREAERCILTVAKATRFPAPHGGEADFTWPLELPPDPDVRPPVALDPELARAITASRGPSLIANCGGAGQVIVTVYVDPDGEVVAAGVATPDPTTDVRLDCLAEGVRAWRFPSPGSYQGKLSFALP